MFNIKNLFGGGAKVSFPDLIKQGAQIVDVRTWIEFQSGNIKGSVNIPLQGLVENLSQLKKEVPVITCCASGMRSAKAKNILETNGFRKVYNGMGWSQLQKEIMTQK